MTPFRSEKNSNWEGGYRVPAMFRWPGKIKPDQVSNDIVSHQDWLPTLLAALPAITDGEGQVAQGLYGRRHDLQAVHLDGDNLLPYLTGQGRQEPTTRRSSTSTTTSNLTGRALRQLEAQLLPWSNARLESMHVGLAVDRRWRGPIIFNLRDGPVSSGRTSPRNTYVRLVCRPCLRCCVPVAGLRRSKFAGNSQGLSAA